MAMTFPATYRRDFWHPIAVLTQVEGHSDSRASVCSITERSHKLLLLKSSHTTEEVFRDLRSQELRQVPEVVSASLGDARSENAPDSVQGDNHRNARVGMVTTVLRRRRLAGSTSSARVAAVC